MADHPPPELWVSRPGRSTVVHVRRRVQCEHEDCREHPELADACLRERRRPRFGVVTEGIWLTTICGVALAWNQRGPLVEVTAARREQVRLMLVEAGMDDFAQNLMTRQMCFAGFCGRCAALWVGGTR